MNRQLQGKPIIVGRAEGEALVTRKPMNFTAAFTKPKNLIPWRKSEVCDRHHELSGQRVQGRVLVFPATIGSTYTGMVLLNLFANNNGPAAMVVQNVDTLLVSGVVLADVWFGKGVPVVEYRDNDLYDSICSGDLLSVDGHTGIITCNSR